MPRIYWTSEAAGQLVELEEKTQKAIRRRAEVLADFPLAGVALKREWEGFRELSAAPNPWILIYTVRDPETVMIAYLRQARGQSETR